MSDPRLLVRVALRRSEQDGKYYISQQEDFYQPEDILYLTIPLLGGPLVLVKQLAGYICGVNAAIAARLGLGKLWRPDPTVHPGAGRIESIPVNDKGQDVRNKAD